MIQQQALSLSLPIFSLMLFSLLPISTADSNIYVKCSQLYFTPTTPYESNLNSLFTSLVDSSSVSNFNKFEISSTTTTTPGDYEVAYGLFQCRGDLNSSNCRDCVTSSVSQLKTACPVSTGGTIQLDGCFVKYDNASFFGVENKMEVLKRCGPSLGDRNSDSKKRVDDALSYLTSGNGQYFREGSFGSIEGVAQCIQDLSASDCQDCLSQACEQLTSECGTSSWGNMFLGTCYIQYADNGDGNNSSDSASRNVALRWIGYVLTGLISSGFSVTATYKIVINKTKNFNNNVINTKFQQVNIQLEDAKKQIQDTKKKADDAEKKAEEIKLGYVPPPYPYPYTYPYNPNC